MPKLFASNKASMFSEQKLIFAYQSRSNQMKYNYPGNEESELCQCGVEITNKQLYYCSKLNQGNIEHEQYERIFYGTLVKRKEKKKYSETNGKKHRKFTSTKYALTNLRFDVCVI